MEVIPKSQMPAFRPKERYQGVLISSLRARPVRTREAKGGKESLKNDRNLNWPHTCPACEDIAYYLV